MKITRLPVHAVKELEVLWNKNTPYMADADRPIQNLVYLLTSDNGDSQWYVIDDSDVVFFIRNVIPGVSATFGALNLHEANPGKAKDELRVIMREFDLRRLTYLIPAPVIKLVRCATRLGFWPEGRMKDAVIYEGKYVDTDVLGFYRSEVEDGRVSVSGPAAVDPGKPKKRRRRSRRKKKQAAQESTQET